MIIRTQAELVELAAKIQNETGVSRFEAVRQVVQECSMPDMFMEVLAVRSHRSRPRLDRLRKRHLEGQPDKGKRLPRFPSSLFTSKTLEEIEKKRRC